MIERLQKPSLKAKLAESKLLLIRGPKGTGKQSLIENILNESNTSFCTLNCDDKKERKNIESNGYLAQLKETIIVLREAQHLPKLRDIIEDVLMGKIKHTLVVCCSYKPIVDEELIEVLEIEGMLFNVYAPSFNESATHFGLTQESELLEERLIYGNYPTVLSDLENAESTLRQMISEIINTQLSAKDRVNKGDKLMRMLQLLAFNVGEPISYNDIGERCGLDNETVERYIHLFEDAFVLIKLPAFYNDNRYELKKTHCVYFQDNGIRNALISNFNSTSLRNDMNDLWRNYMISERIKWIRMNNLKKKVYFWRTHTRQQMDFIEVGIDQTMAYKSDPKMIGWEKRKNVKIPKSFTEFYPNVKTSILNKTTYWNFLTRKV